MDELAMSEWMHRIWQVLGDLFAGAWIKSLFALGCAGVMSLLDIAHPSVKFLLALMLIDFALGGAKAWKKVQFSFAGIKRGIAKFIVYGLALTITSIADEGLGIRENGLTWAFCCFLIVCEALSALRHLTEFGGPQLPAWLFVRLEYLKNSIESPGRRKDDWRCAASELEERLRSGLEAGGTDKGGAPGLARSPEQNPGLKPGENLGLEAGDASGVDADLPPARQG